MVLYRYFKAFFPFVLCFSALLSCRQSHDYEEFAGNNYSSVPKDFPPIPFPDDNSYSPEKEVLGRYLFFDKILSRDSMFACASCHNPRYSFASNVPNSITIIRFALPRNVLPLTNVAYKKAIGWIGSEITLEEAIFHDFESPLFFDNDTNEINRRLRLHPYYPKMFESAFGKGVLPTSYLAAKAIATFVRTLISGNSAYDRYVRGDTNALTDSQKRGMKLFFSERTRCSVCHSGFLFTDLQFHNTGTSMFYADWGRYYVTKDYKDKYKFITPSLRNVEVSGPYLHDGTYKTLEEVIENYNRGGYPFINKDTLLKPLNLTKQEKEDLINFLKSLTDWEFLNQNRFKSFGY